MYEYGREAHANKLQETEVLPYVGHGQEDAAFERSTQLPRSTKCVCLLKQMLLN